MTMTDRNGRKPDGAEKLVRDIRRATRRQYSAEENIRIVLEGLRGETSIAELCRKEGIAQSMYYGWSKEFLGAGIHRIMEQQTNTNILFLDACRDNPLARNLARGMGTRSTEIGKGLAATVSSVG
jgi:transposase